MEKNNPVIFLKVFKSIFSYFPKGSKKYFNYLLITMVIAASLETLTAGSVALFMTTITNPERILHSTYILKLRSFLPYDFLFHIDGLIIFISSMAVGVMTLYVIIMSIVIFYSSLFAAYMANSLGKKLLTGFLKVPYERTLSKNSADLVQSINWRSQTYYFIEKTLKILSDSIATTILLIALFYFAPFISIPIALIVVLCGYFLYTKTRAFLDKISVKVKDYQISINLGIHTALHGIKDIKTYGRESLLIKKYHLQANNEARLIAIQHAIPQNSHLILQLIGLSLLASTVCVLFFFTGSSSTRVIGIATLLAVTAWRVLPAINRIIQNLNIIRITIPMMKVILNYLKEVEPYTLNSSPHSIGHNDFKFRKRILFKNVSFSYEGSKRRVLQELTFDILRGKTVGVIGVSGSGKSTLVDLILGLLNPKSGEIAIDENIFDNKFRNAWVRKVGYVPQKPYICVGSVAENIAFGFTGDEIDRERVATCCKMAAMGDFLGILPDGIDTQIGEDGVKLSGGQVQRVAIARALYHYPEVVIFDEATSSLDTKSEKAILNTIYSLKGKLTIVIIAHRLSTVEECDEIIWLENGRIVRIGVPDEVLTAYRQVMKEENGNNDDSFKVN